MDREELRALLERVASGDVDPGQAERMLAQAPFVDLGFAKIDTHRGLRQGVSEVIYGAGKTAEQIARIVSALAESGQQRIMVTRIDQDKYDQVAAQLASSGFPLPLSYHPVARLAFAGCAPEPSGSGLVVVAAAGTSDLPVSEEAALTAEYLGNRVERLYDVGVAGIHRLLAHADTISQASVIVAVAGMEGALASVVSGLAACPVIAVPTSVGYGAAFDGLAALLAMLNSCASGVSVVNIDNGFGAGYQAHMINHVK